MFHNIGKTIKVTSQVLLCCSIILSVLGYFGLLSFAIESHETGAVIEAGIIAIIWIVLSGVVSFLMYGFGQLIENTQTLIDLNVRIIEQNNEKKEG